MKGNLKMSDMVRIINPVTKRVGKGKSFQAYVRIKFSERGELSILEYEGTEKQRATTFADFGKLLLCENFSKFNNGFNKENIEELVKIRNRWHFNSYSQMCEHQIVSGVVEKGMQKVGMNWFETSLYTHNRQKEIEKKILQFIENNDEFSLTKEEMTLMCLPHCLMTYRSQPQECVRKFYFEEPVNSYNMSLISLSKNEHPDGLLGETCLVCGHEIGEGSCFVSVPQDVIDWLFSLPEAEHVPEWLQW
jgi:hypothetical protein